MALASNRAKRQDRRLIVRRLSEQSGLRGQRAPERLYRQLTLDAVGLMPGTGVVRGSSVLNSARRVLAVS